MGWRAGTQRIGNRPDQGEAHIFAAIERTEDRHQRRQRLSAYFVNDQETALYEFPTAKAKSTKPSTAQRIAAYRKR